MGVSIIHFKQGGVANSVNDVSENAIWFTTSVGIALDGRGDDDRQSFPSHRVPFCGGQITTVSDDGPR